MVDPTCFGITLPSSESVPSAFGEMLNWGAVDKILWMGVLCLVTWCVTIWDRQIATHHVYWYICWFSRTFLLGILIFKGPTTRPLHKSFGIKGLKKSRVIPLLPLWAFDMGCFRVNMTGISSTHTTSLDQWTTKLFSPFLARIFLLHFKKYM
jgi:hypothetical protein